MKENIVTLPNILSLGRILSSPILSYAIINEMHLTSLSIFSVCAVTDMLDGYLARRSNQVTYLGSVLDPISDKTLITTSTVSLAVCGLLPVSLVGLIVGRDFGLLCGAIYYRYTSLPSPKTLKRYFDFTLPTVKVTPTLISKVNTVLQILLVTIALSSPLIHINDTFYSSIKYSSLILESLWASPLFGVVQATFSIERQLNFYTNSLLPNVFKLSSKSKQ